MINPENANKIPNRGVVFFSAENHIHVSVIIVWYPPENLSSTDELLGQAQGVEPKDDILCWLLLHYVYFHIALSF